MLNQLWKIVEKSDGASDRLIEIGVVAPKPFAPLRVQNGGIKPTNRINRVLSQIGPSTL